MRRAPVIAIDLPTATESEQKPAKRLLVGQAGLLACALVIVIQLVRWQVIERAEYLEGLQRNLGYQKEILPERGWILDRDGAFLALNHYDYTIEGAPNQIEERDTVPVAKQLADLLVGR
jgi:cell division protein FtsI/penicillin-binding protein 2